MSDSLARTLLQEYQRIEQETARLATATGLACPSGCGRCCHGVEVLAAEVEMLPMAGEILARGEAEGWLARLAGDPPRTLCPVYEPEAGAPQRGRCGLYAWRPLVCRLFGFSARTDKHGRPELVHCRVHEEETPAVVARARAAVAAGEPAPRLHEESTGLRALDPSASGELLPVGLALRRALEKLALAAQLASESVEGEEEGDPRDPPARPRHAA
jgi:Fe-S-cluster containining protein